VGKGLAGAACQLLSPAVDLRRCARIIRLSEEVLMKIFKAVVYIGIFLLIIFGLVYWVLRHFEIKRWEKFKSQYYTILDTARSPESDKIVWQGKVLEVFEDRTVLLQGYQFKKPTDFKFYAVNYGSYLLQLKPGEWLEVRGEFKEFYDGIPVLSTIYFDKWLYLYYDIGIFQDVPDRLERR
jgi:hypothetical protein